VIGTNSANRNEDEAEGLVGSFVNNLVLRTRFTGDPTFRELLEKVRTVALEAYAHQDVPFEVLLEELRPDRARGYAPLFQVMFVFQNFPMEPRELPGLQMSGLDVQVQTANFDLVLMLAEGTGAVDGSLIYDAELFEPSAVTRMLEHYQRLLETVVADPDCRLSDIPMVHRLEAQQLASSFSEDF
jgi:non-ribosomal peptide synthetase component F